MTGLAELVEDRVDGITIAAHRHAGQAGAGLVPRRCGRLVGVEPAQAAVFEDATAGVQAGRRGGFGYVVGVNRHDDRHGAALHEHGADVVVGDLGDLL